LAAKDWAIIFPFRTTKVRVYCGMVTRRNSG
jgi:hypothetical protein